MQQPMQEKNQPGKFPFAMTAKVNKLSFRNRPVA